MIKGSKTQPEAEKVTQPAKCGTLIASRIKGREPFLARTFILLFAVNMVSSMFRMRLG